MPVIKTDSLGFDGATFKRVIKVDRRGVFSCDMPPAVKDRIGKAEARGETLEDCLKDWNKIVADYKQAQTTERKNSSRQ